MAALPPVGANPRQARSLATRERYYEATLRRFGTDGVERTRVQDVLDDAGGSWGSYHHYFPRKEDVLIERVVRRLRELRPAVEAALADDSASIQAAVADLLVGFAVADLAPELHGAAIREAMSRPQRLAAMLNGDPPPVALVGMLLAAGQERGEVHRDADPYSLAAVLSAGTIFPVLQTSYGTRMHGFEQAVQPPDPAAAVRGMLAIAWRAVAA